ncbi:MAG: DMT family transporter [Bdellovibrionales bacterium]|nr:DMT family transporter [Bdellovibrionales bacterium]
MNSYKLGLLFAAGTSLCWAILAIALKYALNFADSGSIAWFRMLTAAVSVSVFFAFKNPKKLKILWSPPKLAVVAGVLLAINYFSYMKGLELTGVINAQVMIQLATIFLILAGIFYFKEFLSLLQWLGVFIAGCGFVLFYWDQLLHFADNLEIYFYGNLWLLLGSLLWAAFAVSQKKLAQKINPQQSNMLIYVIAAIFLIVLADFTSLANLNFQQWLILFILGLNTVIAYGCLGEALKRAPASHVGFIIALDPLGTFLILQIMNVYNISIIENEPISLYDWIGALLVAVGIGCALLTTKSNHNQAVNKNK